MRMRSARGRRSLTGPALVLVVVLGASACTSDDGGEGSQAAEELPVEVEGEVLDRRDEEDDADDPATDDGDQPTTGDEDREGDAEDEGDADDTDDAVPDDADVADGDRDRGGAGTSGTAPARPSPTPAPTRTPARTPAATPSPEPAPRPDPVATPAPRSLADGPAEPIGPVLSSDGTAWTETSSTSVEQGAEPPPLTVAMRPGEDAPRRQVRCQAALEAPSDRGLAARGTLTVSLRIVTTDGDVQVVPRQRIDLDVVLAAGQRRELEVSPARTVDVADVQQVTCVAELDD